LNSPIQPAGGDFALVIPSAEALDREQARWATKADRSRAQAAALRRRSQKRCRAVLDDDGTGRPCWSSAPAAILPLQKAAEKLGGTAVSRLLTSGETHAVIDLTGLDFDADSAAGSRLPRLFARGATTATGPSSRTSRSRPWRITIVGGGEGRGIAGQAAGSRSPRAST
jgi:leucyl aminopeptidase